MENAKQVRLNSLTDPDAIHIFLDLETWSTRSNALIASIGAVAINLHNPAVPVLGMFYQPVDSLVKDIPKGFVTDAATVDWWLKQDLDARMQISGQELIQNRKSLVLSLEYFMDWLMDLQTPADKVYLWGRGSDFDNVILRNAIDIVAIGNLADYIGAFNHRCHRTYMERAETELNTVAQLVTIINNTVFGHYKQLKHIALNDAMMEATQMLALAYEASGCNIGDAADYYQQLAAQYHFPLTPVILP